MEMTNTDKLNKSMDFLVGTLLDITEAISECNDYNEIDTNMVTVDKLTTNIKRLFDAGVELDSTVSTSTPIETEPIKEKSIKK